MKSLFQKLIYAAPLAMMITSCDKGFEEMNVDPNKYSKVVPEFMFTRAQLDGVSTNFTGAAYLTIGQSMQHFATYKEVPAAGDKYFNFTYSQGSWNAYAGTAQGQGSVISINQVIDAVKNDPLAVNKLSAARIWRAYIFHRLTDVYGDIPYFDAGKALTDKNYGPKYDTQQAIYADMLKELDESIAAFDASKANFASADLMYGGKIDQWKKFAYSLMLRLGMRLTEVDNAMAKTWVQKAIAGGVILEDVDRAIIGYVDGSQTLSRNFIANGLMNTDYTTPGGDNVEGGKFAKTFIDYLKTTNDPRLNVVSIVWREVAKDTYVADTSTVLQKGMPNAAFNSRPAEFNTFSEPNPATVLRYASPLIVFGNAETNLLLAEAAVRGWYTGSTAKATYEAAVKAGLRQWALFGAAGMISDAKINAYVANNPYNATGTVAQQIEQIATHKWVALFLEDEYEIFSNWRRTGYPKLTPTNYPGNITGGKIPTRFVIPDSEEQYNNVNFLEARSRQGGTNTFSSVVWWDK
ncbi:SusD/RagB family nutrient-binding outer membrane lipoprotein [Dyadobacter jiangsuensis]|uniref:SusD-like starch-binding protein associating with outer membrane n=1 Tax=Dyadobacter jiangsuensis TaxID=1591085 RepID=A0A2P8FQL5_9BACT|nr:SusD/RagB family nutrient-binding outer membrane lipoprotein [Dyadobacter jiangsuensis]PSL23955.1 SusD-like starch-binding protein associating with outer membrane [Dyadobacter jiangsuensis]